MAGPFQYLTAEQWGMTWARTPIGEKLLDPELYVHHSAGGHPDEAAAAFRALNEYAINVKGYSALDYDILVHRSKKTGLVTIGEGRGKWMSAATLDRNELGEAICVLGYFHPGHALSRAPHADELEGTALGIVWGIEQGWIAPLPKILGHRDNPAHPNATGCPGDYLYAQLPWIRARVAALQQAPAPTPPPAPAPAPTPTEDDMRIYCAADSNGTYWVGNGVQRRALSGLDVFSNLVVLSNSGGGPQLCNTSGKLIRNTADVLVISDQAIDALGQPV